MLVEGKAIERLEPVANGIGEVDCLEVECEFAALVFAEVEYLVDEAQQHLHVLVGQA